MTAVGNRRSGLSPAVQLVTSLGHLGVPASPSRKAGSRHQVIPARAVLEVNCTSVTRRSCPTRTQNLIMEPFAATLGVAGSQHGDRNHVLEPRLLNAKQAAAYLGYTSPDILRKLPVQPVRLSGPDGQPRWDKWSLDQYLDKLSGMVRQAMQSTPPLQDDVAIELASWSARRGH